MIDTSDILNAKILIVDDLEANVRLLEKTQSGAGYTCVASTMDSQQVCALHRKNRYDLILLDLLMPGLDGFAVLEGLKAIETERYVSVLVVTAQPGYKLRALQAGAKDFISKPFDLVELTTRIHNMLEVRLCHNKLDDYNKVLEQTLLERTAELRASEERFRHLTQLASDWYWEQDENGRLTETSGPALEMLGIRGDGSPTDRTGDVQGSGWNESERAELESRIAGRQLIRDFVFSRTNADGSRQYFQVSGDPVLGGLDGRYSGYRGIGIDVTRCLRRQ